MKRRSGVAVFAVCAAAVAAALLWRSRSVVETPDLAELTLHLTPTPPPTDRYRGDIGGFERRARTIAALRPENRRAYLALANAEIFTSAGIGASGQLSKHVAAFQQILADPEGDAAFKELVSIAGMPGQLYGLSGTYFTDPVFFRQTIRRYRVSAVPIVFLNGCNYGHDTVGAVAKLIEEDDLPQTFQAQDRTAKSNGRA